MHQIFSIKIQYMFLESPSVKRDDFINGGAEMTAGYGIGWVLGVVVWGMK